MAEWNELTQMTRGAPIAIERVRLVKTGVRIEGDFDLPPLARLTFEDQVFIATFVRCHGSIKEMEKSFGISYPTVKNRLNKIADQLGFVTAEERIGTPEPAALAAPPMPAAPTWSRKAILERLERGEITPDRAVEELKQC